MKDANDLFTIDANFILRYFVGDVEDQYKKAESVLLGVEKGSARVFCDPVTLSEVVWVLRKFYELDAADVANALLPLVSLSGFVLPNKARYVAALRLHASGVDHFGDACACAAAAEHCGGRLLSFDRELSKIPGIKRLEETPA